MTVHNTRSDGCLRGKTVNFNCGSNRNGPGTLHHATLRVGENKIVMAITGAVFESMILNFEAQGKQHIWLLT